MSTAIQDLAAKLNQSSLTLDEVGLGSKKLADLLSQAFLGKVLELRDVNSQVSIDESLQFQGAADLFLGVYRQSVRLMAFIHEDQLELVLLAKLPARWDFSWGYPDLPEYVDSSDPSGEAKPSFFSELRFGNGLTALFSSYDFSQGASAETIELLNGFDSAVVWTTVLQGLNYRGEIDLAAMPFMTLLSQLARVDTSLPVSGALYHNEFGDEIRLQLGLSFDTTEIAKGLPFKIGVSALALSSSASLYAPEPRSGIQFLGDISFGGPPQDSHEVALFWPIGSKQLILSNVGPIPFPGLDKLLAESDLSAEDLNSIPKDDWNAFQIHEIVLGVSWDPVSITSLWCSVGSPEGWNASFLPDDLKNLFSVEDYLLRFELKPRAEVSAQALLKVGGGLVHLSGVFPDLTFAGGLAAHQKIDVSGLLGLFLPTENGNGNSAPAMSSLEVLDLDIEADFKQNIYAFDLDISSTWEISIGGVKTLPLSRLRLSLEKEGDWTSVSVDSLCTIAGVDLNLYASYAGDDGTSEWKFYGKTAPDVDIPFGELMKDLALYFGGDENSFPKALETFVVRNLRAEFYSGAQSNQDATFHCEGEWTVADHDGESLLVDLYLTVTRKTDNGTRITTFDGKLTVGDLDFTLAFIDEATTSSASDLLVATYHHESDQQQLKLGDLLRSVVQDDTDLTRALDSVSIDLKDAIFAYSNINEQKKFLFGLDIGARLSLTDLPLVGKAFPIDSNVSIDNLQAILAWKPFEEGEVKRLNALLPNGVNKLPEVTKTSNDAGSGAAVPEQEAPANATAIVLQEGFTIGATLNLGNISRPLALQAAGPSTTASATPPTPTPSPESTPTTESGATPAAAPPIDTATWFKIQNSLGPVYFERIGVQYKDSNVWFLLDAALTAAGLTLSLDGLSIGSPIDKFDPSFDLRGLGIDYSNDALEIGGGFLKIGEKEYAGAAVIKAKQLTLSALGMYKEMADGHPSVFVYAVLDYPIGGPSFFFVTGLAAGFGYNRALKIPTIDKVANFSLVKTARNGDGERKDNNDEKKKDIGLALQNLASDITPAPGENFLAIGVKFTSFKIVESFALLTVSFGNHFEMDLLGLSSLVAPANAGANVPPVAEAQLALKASFQPDKGFLGVQAQLTPNSYILSKDCHLTGGFAFYSWFDGSEHNGDFVLTLGGYHPNFHVPAHYPTVPRLGFNWQVSPELSIKGDAYFALTASALMAGGHLEANWLSGSVHAWFKLGADFLIAWKPYHYEISAYVDIGAEVTFEFFGTQRISVDVGADLRIWGPEFSGEATIHLWIISFTVSFGAGASHTPPPIDWPTFKSSFLPADKDVCSITVTGGMISKDSKDPSDLGAINPKEFSLTTNSVIPSTKARYALEDNKYKDISLSRTPGKFGIGSMEVPAADLSSTQTITIKCDGDVVKETDFEYTPIFKKVPAGLWGESLTPEVNGKQFVEDALCGFEIRPQKKQEPGETAAIELGKLQEDGFSGECEYRWETVNIFTAAPFKSEQERREKLRRSLAADAAGRNAILAALGFTADDMSKITLSAAQADDFLIAPQIEQI